MANSVTIHWMTSMATIKEIKELLATVNDLESPVFLELEQDNRSGVQKEISVKKPFRLNWMRIFVWSPCFPMKKNFISKD